MFPSFSSPNININTGPARRGSEGPDISYPVSFIQGPVAEDSSQKLIQVSRNKCSKLNSNIDEQITKIYSQVVIDIDKTSNKLICQKRGICTYVVICTELWTWVVHMCIAYLVLKN